MASGRSAVVFLVLLTLGSLSEAYTPSLIRVTRRPSPSVSVARPLSALGCSMTASSLPLHDPAIREAQYKDNMAQYLVDLHDSRSVFDFCGGMMFQLILSEKLRSHLASVSEDGGEQPAISDAATDRMMKMPGYRKDASADNIRLFHGREVREVPTAAGGFGFALHLSFAGEGDPEGWTPQEVASYDGWGHDASRTWRNGERLESEGFAGFRSKFGPKAFTLNHRFYLHLDRSQQMWLSAEDGCEGHPAHAR